MTFIWNYPLCWNPIYWCQFIIRNNNKLKNICTHFQTITVILKYLIQNNIFSTPKDIFKIVSFYIFIDSFNVTCRRIHLNSYICACNIVFVVLYREGAKKIFLQIFQIIISIFLWYEEMSFAALKSMSGKKFRIEQEVMNIDLYQGKLFMS